MTSNAEVLPWDSEFFGYSIGRYRGLKVTDRSMQRMLTWMSEEKIDCTYVLLDSRDIAGTRAVERIGGQLMDVRITLGTPVDVGSDTPPSTIRPAVPADVEILRKIAAVSHHDTRFYADEHFPDEQCDDLYAIWIERSCLEGFADRVLVIHDNQLPIGYVTCVMQPDGFGWIGLIAMAESSRGSGKGTTLVTGALSWMSSQGLDHARVITQGRNTGAIRLYERSGFVTEKVELWYHVWRGSPHNDPGR